MLFTPDSCGQGKFGKNGLCVEISLFLQEHSSAHTQGIFVRLDGIIVSFVWAGKTPTVAWKTLQLPLSQGGLVLSNFQLYYWVRVLVMVCWWFSQPTHNAVVTLKSALLGSYAASFVYQVPKTYSLVT